MATTQTVYLDNSATSWPKPPEVGRAMLDYLERRGGSAGRSAHRRAIEAGIEIYGTREAVARLLGAGRPNRVVFGPNATWALNQALRGLLRPGDRVVADVASHNSVRRPLLALEDAGVIEVGLWSPPNAGAPLCPDELERLLAERPARLVTLSHVSNVLGTIQPLAEICAAAHRHGALVLADCAQSAGAIPLRVDDWNVDLTAFTGHKGLLGPQGTGGLIIAEGIELEPLMRGGGGDSRSVDVPAELPERLEAGTYNAVGLAGLRAGVNWILEHGFDELAAHKRVLTESLYEVIRDAGADPLGPTDTALRSNLVCFNLDDWEANPLAAALEEEYGIQTRSGLHCAPGAHRLAGTFERGAVRASVGAFTTEDELERLAQSLGKLRRDKR